MNISINSAISAYKNAANITKSVADSPDISSGDSVFSSLITSPAANTISSLQNSEKSVFNNLAKKADLTDVVTAISEAESALKTVVAIRDRLVSAFQKIQEMPI